MKIPVNLTGKYINLTCLSLTNYLISSIGRVGARSQSLKTVFYRGRFVQCVFFKSFKRTKICQNAPLCSAATNGNSILFKCPLIGDQVLPKEEMRQAIRNFLYAQLDEEPGLTSCLIIHTINKDQERVRLNNMKFGYFNQTMIFKENVCVW